MRFPVCNGTMIFFSFCCFVFISAQTPEFTRQDTLRGSITKERKWWDLKFYHLDIAIHPG